MQLSSTNSTDGTRTEQPDGHSYVPEKDLEEQPVNGEGENATHDNIKPESVPDIDGKPTTSHDDVLAARGLRRIILNFTPSSVSYRVN